MDATSYRSAAAELADRVSSRAVALPVTAADAPAIANIMLCVSSALQSAEPELATLPTRDSVQVRSTRGGLIRDPALRPVRPALNTDATCYDTH